jgi:hypothetical protein
MWAANCQPTTRRENASMTKLKNTTPSQQRRYVKSAHHNASGLLVLKSRWTRSGGRRAEGSGVVVRHGLPRRLAPWMPARRIRRLTRSRPTCSPARSIAFQVRR